MTIRTAPLVAASLMGACVLSFSLQAAPVDGAKSDEKGPDFRQTRTLRGAMDDESLPALYVVKMTGQMMTDVRSEIYEELLDDIREQDPDVVVLQIDCKDFDERLYTDLQREDQSLFDWDEYRELVDVFHRDLRDYRQVAWIGDALGGSSIIAMSFEEMYMKPEARLGNMRRLIQLVGAEGHGDDDVRGKMVAAVKGLIKGYAQYGDVDETVIDAMLQPAYKLSADWHGRSVHWRGDNNGEFVVDDSDEHTAEFRAKTCEDLLLSDGTAESIDDLALLMGMREYRLIEGDGVKKVDDYIEDWRRQFVRSYDLWTEYEDNMRWAGNNPQRYLGAAIRNLKDILNIMRRYKAVEVRWMRERGIRPFDIETMIEQRKLDLQRGRGVGRGGRSSGGSGGGGAVK